MQNEARKKRKPVESVQFKFVVSFFALIAALLVLMNTYPMIASRDLVFKEKESALLNQASVISSSLSALDNLSADSVAQVMALLDITGYSRVVVTDDTSLVLYDTAGDSGIGKYVLFSEVVRALGGEQVFWSNFKDGVFVSRTAMPVRNHAVTLGAVYLCEYDADQAALIMSIQNIMSGISIAVCIVALLLTFIFSRTLTARITHLAQAIQVVRSGNYSHRLRLSGNDELTELGNEFNNLTERLETTEQERRRFVSDASHELKTPLASIRLLSDSIVQREDMDINIIREFVADIGSEADRLQRTTEKLLDLARRDDGIESRRGPVDIGEVLKSTLRLLSPLADARRVTLKYTLKQGCVISASEDDVYQIIFNLAENAIKYNVEGGSVFLAVDSKGDCVRLIVEDTGIGIPEEDRPYIFSRFYRVDKARSREAGGSGLGLSIVRDAVNSLGGEITVSPREIQGTRFMVTFPVNWENWEGTK
ncbi:MAG: HAMP domain-containing histidine kinase [Clostridia bacterium]|nr:HAMP domain-containing histidine kinase [Clostridia bacterium]